MDKKYIFHSKSSLNRINVSDIELPLPDLKNITEPKALAIAKWLIQWIENDLKNEKIQENNILPPKPELAYLLGVSIGTIQNALRHIEDLGYIESKQCIGSLVKNPSNKNTTLRKLTSKREIAIEKIKQYIKSNKIQRGQLIPSARALSELIGCSANTTRLALDYLCTEKIIQCVSSNSKHGWSVLSTEFKISDDTEMQTLVQQIELDLKNYVKEHLSIGDRMPPHAQLAKELKASIKTIHDGLKSLIDEGILLARRGRYGTTVIKMPDDKSVDIKKETSIFAPAHETAFYYYEKTQNHIKKLIAENYEIGDKLPSILNMSKQMDLSPNTIRRALENLAKEGYLTFMRGRYGGTFVIDKPEIETQSFKWLAVNPQYTKAYK